MLQGSKHIFLSHLCFIEFMWLHVYMVTCMSGSGYVYDCGVIVMDVIIVMSDNRRDCEWSLSPLISCWVVCMIVFRAECGRVRGTSHQFPRSDLHRSGPWRAPTVPLVLMTTVKFSQQFWDELTAVFTPALCLTIKSSRPGMFLSASWIKLNGDKSFKNSDLTWIAKVDLPMWSMPKFCCPKDKTELT